MVVVVVVLLVLVVVVATVAARLVHRVPPGHVGVVRRAGRYQRLVTPGVLVLPPAERVRCVPTTEQQVAAGGLALATLDHRAVVADVRVVYRVADPVRVLDAVDDAAYALDRDARLALREHAAAMPAEELVAGSVHASRVVRDTLTPSARSWGLELVRVEAVLHPAPEEHQGG